MRSSTAGRIICLSNSFDEQYQAIRGEAALLPLSVPKRRDLFRCLELASGREVIILSSPPKALHRRSVRWLPAVETQFSTHRQLVCGNWDGPKVRLPSSWLAYALHVRKHTRSGDMVIVDNYEFLYIVAAYAAKLMRNLTFVLDYEDGKHAVDQGLNRLLSGAAERLGRPLLKGALLAHPALAARLPADLPTELVPGFFRPSSPRPGGRAVGAPVRFLYSGSLDVTRGVDLLLAALPLLPAEGWELHITGSGPLQPHVIETAEEPQWRGCVRFHGVVPMEELKQIMGTCDVALNCQRPSDPISDVTFPSKTFTYLSSGLRLLSSTASGVRDILGDACRYFPDETPSSLAGGIREIIETGMGSPPREPLQALADRYSMEGTTRRLEAFLRNLTPAQ